MHLGLCDVWKGLNQYVLSRDVILGRLDEELLLFGLVEVCPAGRISQEADVSGRVSVGVF